MQQNIIILEYEDLEMSMPIIVIVESFGIVVLLDKFYTKYLGNICRHIKILKPYFMLYEKELLSKYHFNIYLHIS